MKTKFEDFTLNKLQKQTIAENLGVFEPKLAVFENYWSNNLDEPTQTINPFLTNIGNLIGQNVSVIHKYIHSKEDLDYYLKNPGVIINQPESHGISIWYYGLHGSGNGLKLPQNSVTQNEMLDLFDGFGDFPNILIFSSCSIFKDPEFGYSLLEKSGSRGVIGYTDKVPFVIGTIIDITFLSNFFLCYKEGEDPFENLEDIYNNVLDIIPSANDYGFSLFI